MVKTSNLPNNLSNRAKKSNGNGGIGNGNQKTLFQCWTKKTINVTAASTSLGASVDDEVIEIQDDEDPLSSSLDAPSISSGRVNFISRFATSGAAKDTQRQSASSEIVTRAPKVQNAFGGYRNNAQRRCPFYKRVGETCYAVDAFNYVYEEEIKGYFLSHFHSDHYVGLGPRFTRPVYCSEITAKLARLKLKVANNLLIILPMETSTKLPDGTQVQLLNSNHCPGAVIFVFTLKNGRIIMHSGDMRADECLLRSTRALFCNLPPVDVLHLDTTYCDQSYSFPSQNEIIDELVRRVQNELRQKSKSLIVVGAYQIGKERVFQALAEALNLKICVQKEKWNVLQCLNDATLNERLTLDPDETSLHVVPMGTLNCETLLEYLRRFDASYECVLGISATGWEFGRSGGGWRVTRRGKTTVIGAPYSEHSSYQELKRFVQLIRPRRIIPTVNVGNENSRKKMQDIFALWLKEDVGAGGDFKQKPMNSFLTTGEFG